MTEFSHLVVTVAAIFGIVFLLYQYQEISHGTDGVALAAGVAAIAGLGGYSVKAFVDKKKKIK